MPNRRLRTALLLSLALAAAPLCAGETRTHNVLLITLDGVRTQELFGGLDEIPAAHSAQQVYSEIGHMRERFGAATPAARREALMPHFWRELAPRGVVFGNRALGSPMRLQNAHCVSSPGYGELITGAPRAEIVDNTPRRYAHRSALQAVAEERALPFEAVAEFSSWDGIKLIAANRDDAFLMNGGFEALPPALSNPELDLLTGLRREVMGLWEEGSDDVLSFRIAQRYIRAHTPRLVWIGLGNSDDWSHADRYDRLLAYLHLADRLIAELWREMQSMEAYRDRTTLIITTDHGRGVQATDWQEHDCSIPGSEQIWALVVGPDTPATGEARDTPELFQGQVAATVLQYFGLPPSALGAEARAPLPGTLVTSAATR